MIISQETLDAELFYAVLNDKPDEVNDLLAKGAHINAVAHDLDGAIGEGFTPLMVAANQFNNACLRVLIEQGAMVDFRSNILGYGSAFPYFNETSALIVSAHRGIYDNVKLLLDHGADVHQKNSEGRTALIAACANFSSQNNSSLSLFSVMSADSSEKDSFEIVKLLVAKGAHINHQDHRGECALMSTFDIDPTPIKLLKYLIDQGADTQLINMDLNTTLDIAKRRRIALVINYFQSMNDKKNLMERIDSDSVAETAVAFNF